MINREINILIATKVMGWKPTEHPDKFTFEGGEYHTQDWSTDIAAAWEVLAKADLFGKYYMTYCLGGFGFFESLEDDNQDSYAWAKTAPMAICLAALKAKGVDIEES